MSVIQRKFTRFKVAWRAKVAVPPKGLIRGMIKGVSVTGGYLEFPIAMPIGSVILMEIHPILNGQIYPIRVKATVTYDALLSDNRGHGLGLKVMQISQIDKDILRKAIAALR